MGYFDRPIALMSELAMPAILVKRVCNKILDKCNELQDCSVKGDIG